MSDFKSAEPGAARPGLAAVFERLWRVEVLRYEVLVGALLLPVLVAGHARLMDYLVYVLLALALFAGESFRVMGAGLLHHVAPEGMAEAATLLRGAELGVTILRAALILLVISVLAF
ncbi:hypothetical protein [Thioclava pacifica]|uniref:Uncharacterized protein n=1 Tax=Thioclava pacifica DSM 10166 TaxID=1353537 RepID=A0A074K3V6_9RHOB|nr:hypothetical protein [Thioclava pacifica]KEO56242.1 hypothetical protein TP2_01590 [Thioclava pacifica DSM 10166]